MPLGADTLAPVETSNARGYRQEAHRVRMKAATMTNDVIRRQMLELALEYERLASSIGRVGRDPLGEPS